MALSYKELGRPYKDGSYSKGIRLVDGFVEKLYREGLLPRTFKAMNKRPRGDGHALEYAKQRGGVAEQIESRLGKDPGPRKAQLLDIMSPYDSEDHTISGGELDSILYKDEPDLIESKRSMRRRELIKSTNELLEGTGFTIINVNPIEKVRVRQWPPPVGQYYLQRPRRKV